MKKRIIAMITVVSFLVGMFTMEFQVSAESANSSEATIRIVHTNDIHGYYTKTDRGQIGFSALKAAIDQQEADLILDVGDTFHGQAFATIEKGESIAELMDAVGYDAMTPGNHDWSYGKDQLKQLDEQHDFAILAGNVVNQQEQTPFFDTPYLIKEVQADDGTMLKVGVFGVIDDQFYSSTVSSNVEGITFTEEAAKATEIAATLRKTENCDIVIAMTHQADCEGFVSNIQGIDAVIAGHEHILINKTYPDQQGKDVPVVEAGYYFQNIGVLSLTYDTETKIVDQTKTTETFLSAEDTTSLSDPTVDAAIQAIEQREDVILSQVIGVSQKEYLYSWEEIRVQEQEIGRIVTAAYLDLTGADVAFENAGGIRGGIPNGEITYQDIISISPYGNLLVVHELTGEQILSMVEHSIDLSIQCNQVYDKQKEAVANGEDPYQYQWPDNSGSVLQFGGIQVEYDTTKPAGSRIVQAKIGGENIDLSKTYRVATNNYVISDEDYPEIVGTPTLYEYGTCEEALIAFIKTGQFEAAAQQASLIDITGKQTNSDTDKQESNPSTPPSTSSPATGDTFPIAISLFIVSALGILAVQKKK
ncbi:bifunctional metallophosphatase/5'-nucleotidase [Clostridium facile]|uniref:Bifunctional metallophosphatase/5'-nucleotidase n=1 Tax=Clostridium facile TaxID=2763035 RepID=A0ABR7IN85_9CLOT|nr:bifunctional UDP-sugar hydrolase/5'-nucleotidase [Clostridium facile]MBC5786596.1 bifunctional metallophosphatase/5'-nucleotidase [Clostridium facile]